MSLLSDAKILYHMLLRPVRGTSHAERMESFYGAQAAGYDDFRRRFLRGREQLWQWLPRPAGGVWVDLGGATGANLENFRDDIRQLQSVFVVDLSQSLLAVARSRAQQRGWDNVHAVCADAIEFRPPGGAADVVTFSYSLTMIPDWFAALENAQAMLKPGGWIGVVDFYVSRKHPPNGLRRHGWLTRNFWPPWFAVDNVFPSPDHLPYLLRSFDSVQLFEGWLRIPYLPLWTPYYIFAGRVPLHTPAGSGRQPTVSPQSRPAPA